jgi:hypothetical protein
LLLQAPQRFALCCVQLRRATGARQPFKRSNALATPNYGYEKRQRELAKKRKAEEKKQKKLHPGQDDQPNSQGGEPPADAPAGGDTTAPPPAR